MRRPPGPLLLKQAAALYPEGPEREAFVQALMEGIGREFAIIVLQNHPAIQTFPKAWPLPWQPDWVVRVAPHFRAGKHPLYEKGAFYSLDFSSVFSASVMLAIPEPPKRVLDLCASPGGKAIFAWRAFDPEVLFCNETVRKRCDALIGNLLRCKIERSHVWTADPSVYAKRARESFDLVIVDAPCSGQSLMAKGEPAPGAFTPTSIDACVGRQRRITGNAVHCIRPGGHLLYSTCTYSDKENERIIAWLIKEYPHLEVCPAPHLHEYQSRHAKFPCYRLFPQTGLGAGAFVALLRHTGEPPAEWPDLDFPSHWNYEEASLRPPEPVEKPAKEPERKRYFKSGVYDPKRKKSKSKPNRGR